MNASPASTAATPGRASVSAAPERIDDEEAELPAKTVGTGSVGSARQSEQGAPAPAEHLWWIYQQSEHERLGPYADHEIVAQLRSGQLQRDDCAIRSGMGGWTPLHELPEFCEAAGVAAPEAAERRAAQRLGVRWLLLWNYFVLPAGVFLSVREALRQPGAWGYLLWAALLLAVASGLHLRKRIAWQWNWVVLAAIVVLNVLPIVAAASGAALSERLLEATLAAVLLAVVWLWPNYIYWTKRKSLFVG